MMMGIKRKKSPFFRGELTKKRLNHAFISRRDLESREVLSSGLLLGLGLLGVLPVAVAELEVGESLGLGGSGLLGSLLLGLLHGLLLDLLLALEDLGGLAAGLVLSDLVGGSDLEVLHSLALVGLTLLAVVLLDGSRGGHLLLLLLLLELLLGLLDGLLLNGLLLLDGLGLGVLGVASAETASALLSVLLATAGAALAVELALLVGADGLLVLDGLLGLNSLLGLGVLLLVINLLLDHLLGGLLLDDGGFDDGVFDIIGESVKSVKVGHYSIFFVCVWCVFVIKYVYILFLFVKK